MICHIDLPEINLSPTYLPDFGSRVFMRSCLVLVPRLRAATPLEEARRSWVQNPTDLDLGFFHKQLERFRDPDADDEVATRLVEGRRTRQQKLKEQASASAKS